MSDKLAKQVETPYASLAPGAADPQGLATALAENVGKLSFFDFTEVKIPAGGGTTWEFETLEESRSEKVLDCVILTAQDIRAYYARRFEDSSGSEPPDCASGDAITGRGIPGGVCSRCVYGQWASGKDGKGQACQQRKHMLVLTQYSSLPFMLNLPPTSLKALRSYMLSLVGERRLPYYAVETSISLEKATNASGVVYSKAVFRFKRDLGEGEAAAAQMLSAGFRDLLRAAPGQDANDEIDTDQYESLGG